MTSSEGLNPESQAFQQVRPSFCIGQHETSRFQTLTSTQYSQILDAGFNFATTVITNQHFHQRAKDLCDSHAKDRQNWQRERGLSDDQMGNASLPGPVLSTLTDKDICLFPSNYVTALVAYSSPWIDLCSSDPTISSISHQALNLEVAYANFCGVRSIIIPGPRKDENGRDIARYARAIQECLVVATRANMIIHLPMYREPDLEEQVELLSTTVVGSNGETSDAGDEIDLFSAWDSWHTIRSVCSYSTRLFVALRIPRRLPEKDVQDRWFAEPLHYLTFGRSIFQENRAQHPCLSRSHQEMINSYMRLKNAPWMILYDASDISTGLQTQSMAVDFPTLAEANQSPPLGRKPHVLPSNVHLSYMRYLERQQAPFSALETVTLTSFQDWLQSPLQPLSDNLESATYEMFEGDPVKYDQYELAIAQAMADWQTLGKPMSYVPDDGHSAPKLVVAVAGAGRGPLVTRVIRAAEQTGTSVQLWALEKNLNAFVYLLQQNEQVWGGQVTVVKTDMRGWAGPKSPNGSIITKVDILVTELLGSFGDNELSPECLDGIQRHIAQPHGISIPASYTAHLSPIATPRIFADLTGRAATGDADAFDTPWVVRLFAVDFVAQSVPRRGRFQQAWEFAHPVAILRADDFAAAEKGLQFTTGGGGAMSGSGGTNEHNARHCHLTFVCRSRGVIHGLAGYFESVLYAPQAGEKEMVELSTLPDQIDRKSKDMISWFPIFFPLKQPLYFPQDTELEVSMWRQTDDTKVWYEWMVEAFAWVGPTSRIKVGASEMHSSRKVACMM